MRTRWLYLMMGLFLLLGIGLIYKTLTRENGTAAPIKPYQFAEDERVNEILENDWNNLESGRAAEHHTYGALVRLSKLRGNDRETLALILQKKDDLNPKIREGVALALGNFTEENAEEALLDFLNDEVESVKTQAMRSLGEKRSRVRLQALVQLVSISDELSEVQKVAVYSSLIRVTQDRPLKEKMIGKLVDMVKAEGEASMEAAISVTQLAPRSEITQKAFVEIVKKGKPADIVQRGIYYLSSIQNTWLKGKIKSYINDERETVRVAAIQGLSQLCPEDRHSIVARLLKAESAANIQDIIVSTTMFMVDSQMISTINSLDTSRLPASAQSTVSRIKEGIASQSTRDICSQ